MLRDAYAAFARGDLDSYLSLCTDDITFTVPGKSQIAGTYTRAQFHAPFISNVMSISAGSFREEVLEVVANDRAGVVVAAHAFERSGQRFEYRTIHLYEIRNGRLASFQEFPDNQYLFDDAWG